MTRDARLQMQLHFLTGVLVAALASAVLSIGFAMHAGSVEARRAQLRYRGMSIAAIDAHDITSLPTRVEVAGTVVYRAKEADGDIHLWLCDSAKPPPAELKPGKKLRSHCVVAEIMPNLPVEHSESLVVGARAVLDGITRYDGEHKWVEIHPVERVAAPRGGP